MTNQASELCTYRELYIEFDGSCTSGGSYALMRRAMSESVAQRKTPMLLNRPVLGGMLADTLYFIPIALG